MVDRVAPPLRRSALEFLDPTLLTLIDKGMPTMVASRNATLRPSVSMAVGCLVDIEAGELTVFVSRPSASRLLEDISSGGPIAVVCVQPRSHRAVQFKSNTIRSRPAVDEDAPALARYLASVEEELMGVGHTREFSRCIVTQRVRDIVALTFAPDRAFDQGPGPYAGAALSA